MLKKIYLASSWENEKKLLAIAEILREEGFEVDCFCDSSSGRYVFSFAEIDKAENLDAINMLENKKTQKAFEEDKKWLDWCNICILILPAGNSAHLEAGYAKGQGKKLFILGDFPKGEWDVMYGFADKLFKTFENGISGFDLLVKELRDL